MSRIAENIINAIKRTKKETLTQNEIFKLVMEVTNDSEVKRIKIDNIELNNSDMTISVKGKKTQLQKLEFELIYYLMQNKGKTITREILMRDIWGADVYVGCRTIDVCVCKLRKLVGSDKIKSIKKVGYSFE